jgi:hypothetical protein
MKKFVLPISLAMCLSACGTVIGPTPFGDDTYTFASSGVMGWGSGGGQKARVLRAANDFCLKQGKGFEVIETLQVDSAFGKAPTAELRIRCK